MLLIALVVLTIGLVSSQTYTANTCGLRPLKPSGDEDYERIVGGVESLRGDWPWSCSMRYRGNHICGGSLINNEWIITAAHCVNANPNPADYTWACGLHSRLTSDPWTQVFTSVAAYRHPQYNAARIRNDIALFKLSAPVTYTDYILPVCFPAATDTYEDAIAIATGWGSIISGGSSAASHREVSMPILTDQSCEAKFDGRNDMLDPLTQVCAGEDGQNKDTCQGDSGGPLVVKRDNGDWYLIGLTSWGYGCGDGGVYTRTSAYRDWVLGYTNTLPTGTN